jgi:hypothetical protein
MGERVTPAEILWERAASIRAVRGVQVNPFTRAIEVLERVAQRIDAPIAIVGGLAAIHHQAAVTTLDIDIVVPRAELNAFVAEAQQQKLEVRRTSPHGWHCLVYRDAEGEVEIQVVPEGGTTPRDPEYAPRVPSPQELGVVRGVGYASFAGWVMMKLVAARDKDRYHLGEALRHASQEQIAEAVRKLRLTDPIYLREFDRILRAAEDQDLADW